MKKQDQKPGLTNYLGMINALELSQELIRCKSVTPENDGALELLKEKLESIGFKCELIEFSEEGTEPVLNLYARYGTKAPNLCFAGHTDVVPIGNPDDWSVDPFGAEIKDNVLYGRGAVDMKPAIACFAEASAKFIEQGPFNGSISFLITGDEEAIAVNGTPKLLKHIDAKGEKLDACIVGEPTNPNQLGEMIKIGRRGSITFNLEVNGTQGHVAYPQQADNPIPSLVSILEEINNTVLDEGNEHFQPSNLEVVNIDVGNTADNVIPARASALMNIRFNNINTADELINTIDSICAKHSDDYSLKHRLSGEAFLTEPGKLSDIASEAVKEITGMDPELSTTGGTSDARFIKDYCPVVEFGLINKTAHKVDERVDIKDIESLTNIYFAILQKYFS